MDFMAIYGEAGMIGVVGAMFVYLVVSMSKKSDSQAQTLEDFIGMPCKSIDVEILSILFTFLKLGLLL